MATIVTPPCMKCGERSTVELTETERAALETGALIQLALPERDADFRELVISGIHPACWAAMFPDEDDDECEGHESLDGAHMGETVYCDGSCQKGV